MAGPVMIAPEPEKPRVSKKVSDSDVCPIKPNEDRVIIKVIPPEPESKIGLWTPEDKSKALTTGLVMAVGPNVKYIEVGWKVMFPTPAGYPFTYDDVDYKIIRAGDISAWE